MKWKKDFYILWQGQFISQLGNYGFTAATSLWLTYKTNSGPLVSLVLIVPQLIQIFFGLFAGAIVDSFSRRKIFIFCDIISGLTVTALAFFVYFRQEIDWKLLVVLISCTSVIAFMNSLFYPCYEALLYDLIPSDSRLHYRSRHSVSQSLSQLIGPNLGSSSLHFLGPFFTLILDALSFFYGAISTLFISSYKHEQEKTPSLQEKTRLPDLEQTNLGIERKNNKPESIFTKIRDSINFIYTNKKLMTLILICLGINLFSFPLGMLNVFLIKNHFQLSVNWSAFFQTFGSIGALVSGFVFGKQNYLNRKSVMIYSLSFMGLCLLTMSFSNLFYLSAFAYALFHAASIPLNIVIISTIQENVSSEKIGRVFASIMIFSNLTSPLGTFFVGQGLAKLNSNPTTIYLVFAGGFLLISLLIKIHKEK